MKNTILIDTNGEQLISSVDDGTNSLYINDTLISASDWVGSGNYTATIAGHAITIAKVASNTGNIIINKISDYNYELSQTRYMPPGLLDAIYPVGSIYMNVNAVDPGVLFGGTWEPIEDRFLLAAGDTYNNGATGGAATVKLTAAQSGVPAHNHTQNAHSHGPGSDDSTHFLFRNSNSGTQTRSAVGGSGAYTWRGTTAAGFNSSTTTDSKTPTINNNTAKDATSAHNNMPPYLVVNVWKRTA